MSGALRHCYRFHTLIVVDEFNISSTRYRPQLRHYGLKGTDDIGAHHRLRGVYLQSFVSTTAVSPPLRHSPSGLWSATSI